MTSQAEQQAVFGMIGLGTMGRNLLLNMAEHGFPVVGYDINPKQIETLENDGAGTPVKGFTSLPDMVKALKPPRAIMMLVPAGKPVDDVIDTLTPLLEPGDIIIDGGNSHFTDTVVRDKNLDQKGFHFFGMGISGGEEGARKGPSMMPGGDKEAYQSMKPIFEAIAAKVDGTPCVTYIGPGAAGHFVKMVHNGIEYGQMQLIAETYEILRKGLKLESDEIHQLFAKWNEGRLQSFLIEVTRDIFAYKEPGSDHLLLDDIKDQARAKGTGKWTSQVAMDLQTPITVIDTAVSMRDLSKYKTLRTKAAELYGDEYPTLDVDKEAFLESLEEALYFSMIMSYAQGMHLLYQASIAYEYELDLASIATIWRGGCIIRAAFLEDIRKAYDTNPKLEHLLMDPAVSEIVKAGIGDVRTVVGAAVTSGIAMPAFASALSYFDAFRSENMPSNLIQAQRDYFGAHTYELIGKEGVFHTHWTAMPGKP
ncbi:NADP-dependent phosphogluconate dehydrogenase [Spirosoma sp. KUDC1026]|uniref:NADP-dependent phosphogluconate dehydrogenase n=1 Tax=Spirosoma sp. KUDC1026 TaxID=2745947 RepID=UPI00159BA062|nr:NADP-dependent phosphogluconate dehydrogenase [Spirosoma sp. KUDC1026]QKZ13477.1 NADP-dependent phosphogluconate dehydrogenase [Spirosoma sp. KUDC1026]